ncbi:hypothetical protein ABT369_52020 [Dactylosporangium sp. NPDC000244]|uniref:hypothetical protein n=1 Tax=Dactylosporangium sp. NPDC000244 TaxID=3154365 RepID=UPI00332D4025
MDEIISVAGQITTGEAFAHLRPDCGLDLRTAILFMALRNPRSAAIHAAERATSAADVQPAQATSRPERPVTPTLDGLQGPQI